MIHLICPNPAIDRTLLIDSINYGSPNRPSEVREFPGGKSFNVAYALSRNSGIDAIQIHTMLGGLYGQQVAELAQLNGYSLQNTEVQKNTRLCNIIVDTSKKRVLPVYEKGFDLSKAILDRFTHKLLDSIHKNDILVFSGSLMKGMPDNYIAYINQKACEQVGSIRLCVDTSGAALQETYRKTTPYLIKINDEETSELFPDKKLVTPADFLDLLKNEIDPAIDNFIITLGAKGIVARIKQHFYLGQAEPIAAKNPIACGDFFLGRLINGIYHNNNATEILTDALAYSTCNAMNWFPLVTDEQLQTVRPTLSIEEIF